MYRFLRALTGNGVLQWFLIAVLFSITPPGEAVVQHLVSNLSQPQFHSYHNLKLSCLLTGAVLSSKSRAKAPIFYIIFTFWLVSMLIETEFVACKCHQPNIGIVRQISWSLVLILLVAGVVYACHVTLRPLVHGTVQQLPGTAEWMRFSPPERRTLKRVYFVSSPVFGPPLWNARFKGFQKWAVTAAGRLHVILAARWQGLQFDNDSLEDLLKQPRVRGLVQGFLTCELLMLCSTCFFSLRHSGILPNNNGESTMDGMMFLVLITSRYFGLDEGFLWNITEIFSHHALEVDGWIYELRRTSWVLDSISLKATPIRDWNRRYILSKQIAGYTFFTHKEIEERASHLIATSPGYDVVAYNCQAMRWNLWRRIMDERLVEPVDRLGQKHNMRRLGRGYTIHANGALLASLLHLLLWRGGRDAFGDPFSPIGFVRCVLGVLLFIHSCRGIVFGSSTIYGNEFHFLLVAPQVLGILLIARVLPNWPIISLNNISPPGQLLCLVACIHAVLTVVSTVYYVLWAADLWADISVLMIGGGKKVSLSNEMLSELSDRSSHRVLDMNDGRWVSPQNYSDTIPTIMKEEDNFKKEFNIFPKEQLKACTGTGTIVPFTVTIRRRLPDVEPRRAVALAPQLTS